ncbi:MAG TPA: amino acid permease, partial [Chitinophagaceae bacterium]|nr:amino acid permease [Chitinophagaceae bacterium]
MHNEKTSLNRAIGLFTSTLLVAGLMIGSGTFKKIAPMAQKLGSDKYILLAWVLAGLVSMFGAFTYAGLATTTNRTGGIYEYLKTAFGDFTAFLFGWSFFTITGSGAIAALAFVFSQSFNTLIPLPLGDTGVKIFAVITISLLTCVNYRGIKQGGIVNNIVTTAKILGILLLIGASLLYVQGPAHQQTGPAIAEPRFSLSYLSLFFSALISALWAYDGWANITFIAGEVKRPERNLPLAIVGGVAIAMFLYVMLNYGFMRVLSIPQLAAIDENKIAASEAAGTMMGRAGAVIISVLIMTCTFGAANACILVYPRLYYRMAQENRFFKQAAAVHTVFRTPHISLIFSGVWSCILVATGTFDMLTDLVVLASYVFFGLTAWGLIKMKKQGIVKAKVVGYPVTPYIIIFFSVVLIVNNIVANITQSALCILLIL